MAATVRIDFRIGGADAVKRAIASIQAQSAKAAIASAKAAEAAVKKQEKAASDAARKTATATDSATKTSAAKKHQAAAAEIADIEKVSQSKSKAIKKDAREGAELAKKKKAEARELARVQIAHAREVVSQRREVGRAFGRGIGRIARPALAAAGVGLTSLGATAATQGLKSEMDLSNTNRFLQNQTGQRDRNFGAEIRKHQENLGFTMGKGEIGELYTGVANLSGGSGLTAIKDQMGDILKIAKSQGVPMKDMAQTVGNLVNSGVKGEKLVNVLRTIVKAGKEGAVPFQEMGREIGGVTGALKGYKTGAARAAEIAGGMIQLARQTGAKSGAQAGTQAQAFLRDIAAKRKKAKKSLEVDVMDKDGSGRVKSFDEVVPKLFAAAISKKKVKGLFGEGGIFTQESSGLGRKFVSVGQAALKASGEKADSKKGRAVVEEALRKYLKTAFTPKVGKDEIKKDFANVTGSPSEKLKASFEKMASTIGQKLLPKLVELVPRFEQLTQKMLGFMTFVLDNPKWAAFIAAAGSVGKELASASIGAWFKSMTAMNVNAQAVNVSGRGAGGGLLGNGGGKAGANLQTMGAVAVAGTAGLAAGGYLANSIEEGHVKKAKGRAKEAIRAQNLASRIRSGHATKEEVIEGQGLLKSGLKTTKEKGGVMGFLSKIGGSYTDAMKGVLSGDVSARNMSALNATANTFLGGGLASAMIEGGISTSDALGESGAAAKEDRAIMNNQANNARAALEEAFSKPIKLASGQKLIVEVSNISEINGRDRTRDSLTGH